MPQPHLRTRSKKRARAALPGSRNRPQYKREKVSKALCSMCGQPLQGISRLTTAEVGKLNRSKRRIWRIYGGNICHSCLKNALKNAARIV